jgi:hypothetical protein
MKNARRRERRSGGAKSVADGHPAARTDQQGPIEKDRPPRSGQRSVEATAGTTRGTSLPRRASPPGQRRAAGGCRARRWRYAAASRRPAPDAPPGARPPGATTAPPARAPHGPARGPRRDREQTRQPQAAHDRHGHRPPQGAQPREQRTQNQSKTDRTQHEPPRDPDDVVLEIEPHTPVDQATFNSPSRSELAIDHPRRNPPARNSIVPSPDLPNSRRI